MHHGGVGLLQIGEGHCVTVLHYEGVGLLQAGKEHCVTVLHHGGVGLLYCITESWGSCPTLSSKFILYLIITV